jgi:replicative DNA helicase
MSDKPTETQRVPPHSEEAEIGVIGSALLDPQRVLDILVEKKVTNKDFYVPAHGAIYLAIGELWGKGKPIDTLTVTDQMESSGKGTMLQEVGNLDKFLDETPTAANAEHYIEILKQKSLSRMILKVSAEIQSKAYKSDDPEDLRSKAEAAFTRLQRDEAKQGMMVWTELLAGEWEPALTGLRVSLGLVRRAWCVISSSSS